MKLSTSTRISLGFTLLTVFILTLFSAVVYHLFNRGRQRAELQLLRNSSALQEQLEKKGGPLGRTAPVEKLQQRFSQTITLSLSDPQLSGILIKAGGEGLVQHQDKRYMYRSFQDQVMLRDVTAHHERQEELFHLFLFGILCIALISFLVGKLFVTRALADLYRLAHKVEKISIDNFSFEYALDHLSEHDEIRTVADALQTMSKSIQQQITDMRQFVNNVSHELRTPLMILRSTNEVAKKTKKYEELVDNTIYVVDQMETLISTLLILARAETNGFVKEEVSPMDLIPPILKQFKQKYQDKHIQVKLHGQSHVLIQSHVGSFDRILHNLIDNAYKYTPAGGMIEITLTTQALSIADTGIGIAPEHMDDIWKTFWQSDISRGNDQGFGLGLSLVKRLVELHGWHIHVKSEVGKGSTFVIHFT